ncbi:MAG: mandelate racemase/muconate lactonizing enzyme family protein [candidate division Zixibacteria bacterium]|nr:mandelate racemase/muconate lactonizing enzyme family protein [candidate division Zixibacteria bacterium]
MKITKVMVTPLKVVGAPRKHVIHSINPIYMFSDLKYGAPPKPAPDGPNALIVEIDTDQGLTGVSVGGYALPGIWSVIEQTLTPLVMGEDPMRTEWLWERMFRYCIALGREGMTSSAIGMVDAALWDLKGKILGQPVYNLLGGKTKDRLRVYASELYVSATKRGDPDLHLLRDEAKRYVDQGFSAVKQRFGFAMWDGLDGLKKNQKLVETVRDAVGDDVEQMVDGCRTFSADYAIQLMRRVKEFNLSWFEEPVQPHDLPGYARVRQFASMPIAGGENEYGKHGFARWLSLGCADIWQPDVNRAAGVTEVRKIVNLAAAHDITVVPHGGWITNLHVAMASVNIPMVEYFPRHEKPEDRLLIGEPEPVEGYMELSDRPGFGVELNREVVNRFTWKG